MVVYISCLSPKAHLAQYCAGSVYAAIDSIYVHMYISLCIFRKPWFLGSFHHPFCLLKYFCLLFSRITWDPREGIDLIEINHLTLSVPSSLILLVILFFFTVEMLSPFLISSLHNPYPIHPTHASVRVVLYIPTHFLLPHQPSLPLDSLCNLSKCGSPIYFHISQEGTSVVMPDQELIYEL